MVLYLEARLQGQPGEKGADAGDEELELGGERIRFVILVRDYFTAA